MPITILRLGHRHYRDQRLTTHIALTARALGAKKVILSGEKDEKIIDSVKDIKARPLRRNISRHKHKIKSS